ncbi:cell division protein DedD [Streptomyces alfalfae]|uniref:deoxycytidylate deaminase n=1 Tax=Streptomyces alfalfae TaxID=1642299 RepID=UPI001BA71FB6|nr:cell division protein DedD [Streptomyces alfalfae]QUI30653.1 cell division protein DedD [Streptomyces alfalfae]
MSKRPDWQEWALGIADAVATRGECVRSKVGAVLLDRKRRVVMSGHNGTVAGKPSCLDGHCPRGRTTYDQVPSGSDYGNCISLHAEENLLIHARREDLEGGTVFVTRAPCYRCMPRLEAAGVFRVVWRTETGTDAKILNPQHHPLAEYPQRYALSAGPHASKVA